MAQIVTKYKLGKKKRKTFALTAFILTAAAITMAVLYYYFNLQRKKERTMVMAERIANDIQTELNRCFDTTELMKNFYEVDKTHFLQQFKQLCERLQKDNLAIGSMYWAPKGVIKYSYPNEVDSITANFEMLKDPIQGPKSRLALESGKATIAGPHDLIEGGKGFILRSPYYNEEGEFEAFSIMVIDTKQFCQQILERLTEEERAYRFCIRKEEDPTASLDEGGYIICSDGPIENRHVEISFTAPNDTWYITIEPLDGWNPFTDILISIIVILLLLLFSLGAIYLMLRNHEASEMLADIEEEKARLKEKEKQQKLLEEARDAAEAASHAKTLFLNNMSHDIRTPMNAILGFTELIEHHKDDPKMTQAYTAKIKRSGQYLLNIINNVLDMARIDSGKMQVNEEFADLYSKESNVVPIYDSLIEKKRLKLTATMNIKHPYVLMDRTKVHQIVSNLLSNAVKYTPEGGSITMRFEEEPSDREGYGRYVVAISDTGIGMSKEFLGRIYDNFAREHTTTESKVLGTGLGMSIVKKLTDLMGGTIEVESELGKGTTFVVKIDHKIVENPEDYLHEANEGEQVISLEGKRILLTEDNDLNAEIATTLLEEIGVLVERAKDGCECVKMLTESNAGYYDAILMDIQMPNMDGYEATINIRSMDTIAKNSIPIVAMTANAFENDKKKAMDVGMNGHLTKPIDIEALITTLSNILKS